MPATQGSTSDGWSPSYRMGFALVIDLACDPSVEKRLMTGVWGLALLFRIVRLQLSRTWATPVRQRPLRLEGAGENAHSAGIPRRGPL